MVKQRVTIQARKFLYLLMEQGQQLVQHLKIVMELILVKSVFLNYNLIIPGLNQVKTLMEIQVIIMARPSLYLLTALQLLLAHFLLMGVEVVQAVSVYMNYNLIILGLNQVQILMEKEQMIEVVRQFLYLLTDQEWLLAQDIMTIMVIILVMSVFMNFNLIIPGHNQVQILMEKQQMMRVVFQSLCLLMDQGWLLVHLTMMQMDLILVM